MKEGLALLIVEDDEMDARVVERVARRGLPGPTLTRASDIRSAREQLNARPFDVALLDLGLPDATDDTAVTMLRRAAPNLPIVVLSGNEDESIVERLVRRGAEDYLAKSELGETPLRRAIVRAMELRGARNRAFRRKSENTVALQSAHASQRLRGLSRLSAAVVAVLEDERPRSSSSDLRWLEQLTTVLSRFATETNESPSQTRAERLLEALQGEDPTVSIASELTASDPFVAHRQRLVDAMAVMLFVARVGYTEEHSPDGPDIEFHGSRSALEFRVALHPDGSASALAEVAHALCSEVAASHAGSSGITTEPGSRVFWLRIPLPTGLAPAHT